MLTIDENCGYKGVRKVIKCKWVMISINTFIENYYIIKYLVVNANILYNLPVEKEEKEKDEMD